MDRALVVMFTTKQQVSFRIALKKNEKKHRRVRFKMVSFLRGQVGLH